MLAVYGRCGGRRAEPRCVFSPTLMGVLPQAKPSALHDAAARSFFRSASSMAQLLRLLMRDAGRRSNAAHERRCNRENRRFPDRLRPSEEGWRWKDSSHRNPHRRAYRDEGLTVVGVRRGGGVASRRTSSSVSHPPLDCNDDRAGQTVLALSCSSPLADAPQHRAGPREPADRRRAALAAEVAHRPRPGGWALRPRAGAARGLRARRRCEVQRGLHRSPPRGGDRRADHL